MKIRLAIISAFSATRLSHAFNETASVPVGDIGAVNEQLGDQDWIRVTPFGKFPNQVGLQIVDQESGQAMVSAFNSLSTRLATLFRGLPIYEGHPDDRAWQKANPGVRAVAVGRVKELDLRADGVWGRVAWNETGTRLVRGEAPAYTAQSPHWHMAPTPRPKEFRPVLLNSLGLTNQPQIPGTLLGVNEVDPDFSAMKPQIIALLAALGRPLANATAVTDEQLTTAVNEAVAAAPAMLSAVNELASVKPQVGTLTTQLATATTSLTAATNEAATLRTSLATERSARAEVVLTSAVNEGRITAAQKPEWLAKFTAPAADFSAVSTQLAGLKKAINTQSRTEGIGARRSVSAESKQRVSAINEAINAKMTAMGTKDRNAAYLALRTEKPALFAATNAE